MSLIKMNIVDVVYELVEALLPGFSGEDKMLAMSFDLRCEKKDSGKSGVRLIRFGFHRPMTYTKVLLRVPKNGETGNDDTTVWRVCADHDSCWITDGVETHLYRITNELMEEIDPEAKWPDFEVSIHFAIDGSPTVVDLEDYDYDLGNSTFISKETV